METPSPSPHAAELLVANHRRFLAFLERRVRSRDVAEDILQDAFVRSLHRAPEARNGEVVTAWFYRVLRNAVIDHFRRQGAEHRAHEALVAETPGATTPSDTELFEEICGCVRDLVRTLKPEYQSVIRRVDLDGVAVKAFAEEQGITATNAAVRRHRAHQALKRQLLATCGVCGVHGCERCECRQRREAL
jgi:RNA polymerase sigma factor (sigma-70 family)